MGWVEVIGKHASTWKSSYPNPVIVGELGTGTHVDPCRGPRKELL